MTEWLPIALVLLLAALLLGVVQQWLSQRERVVFGISVAAHLASAAAQVWITEVVYGYGDMFGYYRRGCVISELLRYDFARFFPQIISLVMHGPADPPMSAIVVGGESTGAMTAIAGTLCFLLDDSLYACCLLIAVASAASKLVLYHAFRSRIDPGLRDRVMFGVMLVPSVVFWTSALLKEPVAFIGLGPLVWGAWSLADKRTLRGACVMLFGAALVASVKAYVLFAFICAFSVFIYWRRMYDGRARPMSSLRLLGLAGGVLTAFAGLLLLGQLFPAYALDRIVDETADLQQMGVQIEGGSNYSIVSGNSSAAVQLVYAPLALFTALFRPSIFDVRNGLMLANAMETFVLTAILVRAAFTRPFRDLWRSMWRSPVLMFCATFVAVFGVGVGLATTNFGTLSRYRAPLMPFFVVLVLVWSAQGRRPRRRTLLPATAGPVARTSRRQSGWRSR